MMLGASAKKRCKVISQSEGSITFVVDENLPAPQEHLPKIDGRELAVLHAGDTIKHRVIASSFDDSQLARVNKNVMFDVMMKAYAEHRPLVLTPDAVWLCISQGFARHINDNAEAMRDMLVSHEGKMKLSVESQYDILDADAGKNVNWQENFDAFVANLKENTKGDIVDNMCADFSTTDNESRIASQITLMNSMQPYFTYEVMAVSCGIPYITIEGTPEDWQSILARTRKLEQYGLKWWTERLCPVLEEFVKTAKGKPDHQFWRCMMTQIPVDKIRGGGCRGGKWTSFDGWFLTLFPYDEKGRTPEKVFVGHKMANSFLSVDFTYRVVDNDKSTLSETPMKFQAGFVGVGEKDDTFELKPRIGWMVRKDEK